MVTQEQIIDAVVPAERQKASGQKPHNLRLLLANLQNGQRLREGAAIAFTSASAGEGVSHVTQLFAAELVRHTGRRTLIIDGQRLQQLSVDDYLQMPWNCHPTNIDNLWMLPAKKPRARNGASGQHRKDVSELPKRSFLMRMTKEQEDIDTGLNCVDALRVSFDNILIDCGSLTISADAAVLASSVDGIVVVVEAGRARRDEILNAQRTVKLAGGNFLGFVLNKRRYPVPEWLYKRL